MRQKTTPKKLRPLRSRWMERREFLTLSVTASLPLACKRTSADEEDSQAERFFPQSVASGDPRPNSVVLWTRLVDSDTGGDLQLTLELALSEDFAERIQLNGEPAVSLVARASADFCVRVRVEGLSPGTRYYYRFVYESTSEGKVVSRSGRTKTAPAPDADVPVRFGVMSCQDYAGRYYHVLRYAAEQDLDFIVHLGDYIYETAADPSFQTEDDERRIVFDDVDGALHLERSGPGLLAEGAEAMGNGAAAGQDDEESYETLAAQSLDNYRQLYRTYRSDPDLQRLHERFPMIVIWDDHEFSNDCYADVATYTDGRLDEASAERRANADQAWVEYMPVDYSAGPDFEFDRNADFPENLEIYRDFVFGRHVHLVMTDLRRFRGDHVIPEDALPGAIALSEARLFDLLGEVPERAIPYVDVDEYADGALRQALVASDHDLAFELDKLHGNLSIEFLNAALTSIDRVDLQIAPEAETFERGIAYSQLGKTEPYSSFGSRFFIDYEVFSWIARARFEDTDGESERIMGEAQEQWFLDTLQSSERTWKIWGNEFTLMQKRADLRNPLFPANFQRELIVSAEDWDGAPNRRRQLLEALTGVENLVVVTGDIHSFFAGNLGVEHGDRVVEFVSGAVSSATFLSILDGGGIALPNLDLSVAGGLLLEQNNPHLVYQSLGTNGFATFTANAQRLEVSYHQLDYQKVWEPELEGELESHFTQQHFRVDSGSGRVRLVSG